LLIWVFSKSLNSPTPTPAPLLAGDLNSDSQVDIADLVIVGSNFGKISL